MKLSLTFRDHRQVRERPLVLEAFPRRVGNYKGSEPNDLPSNMELEISTIVRSNGCVFPKPAQRKRAQPKQPAA